jgi:hypothetical protein
MGLSDIAAGLETTTEQRDRGVAAVDATERSLAARLEDVEADLPCGAAAAASVVDAFASGSTVEEAAEAGAVAPVTAAKALHRVGVEGVSPLSPVGQEILRDWLAADLTRAEALTLADASEAEFALAAYVETHDPIPGAREAVESALAPRGDAIVQKRDRLAGALQD